MQVVAVAFPAIACSIDKGARNGDAEPADRTLFWWSIQIGAGVGERIERRSVVDEAYPEMARSPPKRNDYISAGRMRSMTVRYGVSEELLENDQKPGPLVIRQTAFVRELVGKGLQPGQLRMRGTERDLRSHCRWSLIHCSDAVVRFTG